MIGFSHIWPPSSLRVQPAITHPVGSPRQAGRLCFGGRVGIFYSQPALTLWQFFPLTLGWYKGLGYRLGLGNIVSLAGGEGS